MSDIPARSGNHQSSRICGQWLLLAGLLVAGLSFAARRDGREPATHSRGARPLATAEPAIVDNDRQDSPAAPELRPRRVRIRILGGEQKVPLADLKLGLYRPRPNDPVERFGEVTTDAQGQAEVELVPGHYKVDFEATKPYPFLPISLGYSGHPHHSAHWFHVSEEEDEHEFTVQLAEPCELALRAVDSQTGEGIAGVKFVTENILGEYYAEDIEHETVGGRLAASDATAISDREGYFRRSIGPRPGWTYYIWTTPADYEPPLQYLRGEPLEEVSLDSSCGIRKAEHVFKLHRRSP